MNTAVIAHRGASGEAPENTLAAFGLAWQQGADGVEMDIHLSADAEVLVHHDASTRRTAGVELVLADTSAGRLLQLDVGSWKAPRFHAERIPTLDEVLALNPAGLALVELKTGPRIAEPLAAVLSNFPDTPVRLISFYLETLLACRVALPERPCYLISGAVIGNDGRPYHSRDLIEQALRHDLAGLDPEYTGIDAAFAAAVREAGLELYTWTVNDPDVARRLGSWGLQGLTGDYPARLLGALGRLPPDSGQFQPRGANP